MTTRLCASLLLLIQEVAANPYLDKAHSMVTSMVPTLPAWSDFSFKEQMFIVIVGGSVLISFLAGVTGIDGGHPSEVEEIPLKDAQSESNPRVFFDITIGGKKKGRITMELFATVVPKTADNFRSLCTGEKGVGKSGKPLHFKGSSFHHVVPGNCQGGKGLESIYGKKFPFEWDNGFIPHSEQYLLSSVSTGFNTNGSQFSILTKADPNLNRKQVVFGRVESGMRVVRAIEQAGSKNGDCKLPVIIADCGEVASKKKN